MGYYFSQIKKQHGCYNDGCTTRYTYIFTALSVFSYNVKSFLEGSDFFLGFCSRFYGKLSVWNGCEMFCYLSGQFASLLSLSVCYIYRIEEHHRARCGGIIEKLFWSFTVVLRQ